MKKNIYLLLILFYPFLILKAQDVNWKALYNTSTNDFNVLAKSIDVDNNGNCYVLISNQKTNASFYFTVLKYDKTGKKEFDIKIDSTNSSLRCGSLKVDNKNDVYISGVAADSGKQSNYFIYKLSSAGSVILKMFAPINNLSFEEPPTTFEFDLQGNIYVAGNMNRPLNIRSEYTKKPVLVKFSPQGTELWSNVKDPFGTLETDNIKLVITEQNILLAFTSNVQVSYGFAGSLFFIKYSSDGNATWAQKLDYNATGAYGNILGIFPSTTNHTYDVIVSLPDRNKQSTIQFYTINESKKLIQNKIFDAQPDLMYYSVLKNSGDKFYVMGDKKSSANITIIDTNKIKTNFLTFQDSIHHVFTTAKGVDYTPLSFQNYLYIPNLAADNYRISKYDFVSNTMSNVMVPLFKQYSPDINFAPNFAFTVKDGLYAVYATKFYSNELQFQISKSPL